MFLALLASLPAPSSAASADLDTLRRVGKAYYENDDFKSAAEQFRQCVARAPDSATDFFNLGLVLMRAADHANALAALDQAEKLDPKLLGPHYLRGIIFKRQSDFTNAIASLRHVVARDPQCLGAYYNLALSYKSAEQPTNAIATLLAALQQEPNQPSCHYQLITLYRRMGDVESAARHAEIFDRIKDTLDESEKTTEALERSRYSYILEVASTDPAVAPATELTLLFVEVPNTSGFSPPFTPPLPPPPPPQLKRADYTPDLARRYVVHAGGSVALGDYDGDGDLDLYVVHCHTNAEASANRLYRNEGGWRFTDVTARAGVGDCGLGMHAVWGDYDNNTRLDLYVVNDGPNVLYRNRGDGTFEDVSVKARVNEPQLGRRAAWVDYDHDGDLDLMVANSVDLADPPNQDTFRLPDDFPGQVNTLLRNNGNGTFADQTDEAGLLIGTAQTREVVGADFDGDHDTDLFVANANVPSVLFLNARLGKFTPGGAFSPAITNHAQAAAEADVNRDGRPDLVVAVGTGLWLYTNDGSAHFTVAADLSPLTSTATISRLRVCDVNNDGWPDLLLVSADGGSLRLLAGAGPCSFREVTAASGLSRLNAEVADLATGDLDGDGDEDIVVQTRDRGPQLLRNDGGNQRHWLNVRLVGRKVNRSGYGATIEVAASGLYQKQTLREGTAHFGLGPLTNVDVVRVTWPNGTAQNIIQPAIDTTLDIEEYVKVSASCAFLWADDGTGFQLVNEILGVGPLGVPMTRDRLFPVDCTELTKIEPGQLVARDGAYELRLTEDLREICYLDQAILRVVDHPAELEILPNEMFTGPPFPEDKFFAIAERRTPRRAVDDRGQDVLDLVAHRDGRYPTFPLTAYDGLAQPHSLTLDFGPLVGATQVLLCLDSWIYWPDSSVSWSIFQNPDCALTPLKLEVCDAQGQWRTAIESVGLPTSKGLVVPVDLTGQSLSTEGRVRLSTTLCVYFDRIFVATRDDAARCRVTPLPVTRADLRFRGFARMSREALGYERFHYDAVTPFGSWDPPPGRFTRYGDVTRLLAEPEDQYVIFGPGDELALRCDARGLSPLPEGWRRSFIFYANGWVKDGDLNTQCSETVEPLPFHGMSRYPYPASEHYPDTPAHREYGRTYNTRESRSRVGPLLSTARSATSGSAGGLKP